MSQIYWTRSVDHWDEDRATAVALGIDPTQIDHLPCISCIPLCIDASVPVANYVIFTSSNAVRFAMADEKLAAAVRAAVKIFTIGPATTCALTPFGLGASPGLSGRSAKELADNILNTTKNGSFLIPGAKEPAFPLARYLEEKGCTAHHIACYDTIKKATHPDGQLFSQTDIATFARTASGAICFASPSAWFGFSETFSPDPSFWTRVKAVAIGETTAAALAKNNVACETSPDTSVASLLTTAQNILVKTEAHR